MIDKDRILQVLDEQTALLRMTRMQSDSNYFAQKSYIDGIILGLELAGYKVVGEDVVEIGENDDKE